MYDFCKYVGNQFGKYHDDVSIEKIDGVFMPVHYDGTDFVNLHPKDNQCDISYIRQIRESSVEMKDLGGCLKTPYVKDYYRFVHWWKGNANSFSKLQKFVAAMSPLNIEILNINNNASDVYAGETNKGKYIKLKDVSYLRIDFSIKKKVDTCNIEC